MFFLSGFILIEFCLNDSKTHFMVFCLSYDDGVNVNP